MTDKLRQYAERVLEPMVAKLEAVTERRQRGNSRLSELTRELPELAGKVHALDRLNGKGYIEATLFVEQSNELNKKLSEPPRVQDRELPQPIRR